MDERVGERLRIASEMVNLPDDSGERLRQRRDRKRRNERLSAGAVSLVLVGALIGGSLVVLRSAGTHGRASVAGGQDGNSGVSNPPVELQPGQYLYMRQRLIHDGKTFSTETWWATDGSGRQRISCPTHDCVIYRAPDGSYSEGYGTEGDDTFAAGAFPSDDDLSALSTDPQTLRDQLLARTAPGGSSPEPAFSPGPELTPGVTAGSLMDAVLNVVEEPNGQPDVKAAAALVAEGVPGVAVRTGATDPSGRPATAIGFALDGGPTTQYYFDPATNLLMGFDPAGSGDTVIYDQAIVGSTDAMPDAGQWLFPPAP